VTTTYPLAHGSTTIGADFTSVASATTTFGVNYGPADQVFNKVDFSSWTVGVSGTWAMFQFSGGFNRRAGTANDVLRWNLLNGDPLYTNILPFGQKLPIWPVR
jgi:hypothetical protein